MPRNRPGGPELKDPLVVPDAVITGDHRWAALEDDYFIAALVGRPGTALIRGRARDVAEVGLVFRDVQIAPGQTWEGDGRPLRRAEGVGSAQRARRGTGGGAGPELRTLRVGAVPDVVGLRAAALAHELLRHLAPRAELRGGDHPPHGAREGGLLPAVPQEHALDEGDAGAPAPAERAALEVQVRSPAVPAGADGDVPEARASTPWEAACPWSCRSRSSTRST